MCVYKKTKGLFERGHPLLTSNYFRSKIYVTCIEVKRGDMGEEGWKSQKKLLRYIWTPPKLLEQSDIVPLYFYFSFTFSLSSYLKTSLGRSTYQWIFSTGYFEWEWRTTSSIIPIFNDWLLFDFDVLCNFSSRHQKHKQKMQKIKIKWTISCCIWD